jgi:hypothetical protein
MTPRTLLSLLLASALLSGCSAASSVADSPDAPAPATPTPAEQECAEVPATVRKHLDSEDVSTVVVEGQCTSIVVQTRLAEEDVASARELCDRAGEVAYVGDINGVTVLSGSGTELSVGITGMKCLP